MSSSPSDERPSEWSLVINEPTDNSVGLSCNYILQELKGEYDFIAVIKHDDDYDENGVKKTEHYHLILKSKKRARVDTIYRAVAKLLKIPVECVSNREIKSFRKAVRYLTHIDYEEKTYYLPSDIVTNDRTYLNSFFTNQIDNLCEEKIIKIVREYKTTSKILEAIGYENYKKWAWIIRDLQREVL